MKKTIAGAITAVACGVITILFLMSGSPAKGQARGQTGLSGIYLFMELQTVRLGKTKRFYDILVFDEVMSQSTPPGARRICEKKADGVDYIFWIETGNAPLKDSVFIATIRQSKNGKQIGGFSGDVSVTKVPMNGGGETQLMTVFGTTPTFYANIWGTRDLNSIPENHQIDKYDSKLVCRYSYQK